MIVHLLCGRHFQAYTVVLYLCNRAVRKVNTSVAELVRFQLASNSGSISRSPGVRVKVKYSIKIFFCALTQTKVLVIWFYLDFSNIFYRKKQQNKKC